MDQNPHMDSPDPIAPSAPAGTPLMSGAPESGSPPTLGSAPIEPAGPITGGRRGRSSLWWIALVVLVGGTYMLQRLGGLPPEGIPDPTGVSSIELKLTGRMVLGMKALEDMMPSAGEQSDTQMGLLLESISKDHEKPPAHPSELIDRVRAIVVIGETGGATPAMEALERTREHVQALRDEGAFDYDDPDTPKNDAEEDLAGIEADLAALESIFGPLAESEAEVDVEGAAARGGEADPPVSAPTISDVQRTDLVARHAWFGELALTYGADPDDAGRRALLDEGFWSLIGILVAGGIIALAAISGLALFVTGIVLLAMGKLRMRYEVARQAFPQPHSSFLGVMTIFIGAFMVVSIAAGALLEATGLDLTFPLIWLLPLVALYPLARGMSWDQLKAGLGWHKGAGVFMEIGAGIVGYLALLPIIGVGLLMTFTLMTFSDSTPSHPIEQQVDTTTLWGALQVILLAAVWAPLTEETIFRGAFYHHLRQRLSFIVPALLTGFVFAFIHPQGLLAIPVLMALGVNFALLREWRGSIIAPITAHALHNGFIVGMLILVLS